MEAVMELRQLRYFVTVAEELHFGKAADRLNIVQPAVSQQVARLERELGLRLLDRSSRRVQLTGDGERILREARAVLVAADRTVEVAAELVAGQTGVFRIGTSPGLRRRLERGLGRLRETAPGIEIKLSSRPLSEQLEAVRTGELDVALLRGRAAVAGVRAVELWQDKLSAIFPTAYSLPTAYSTGSALKLIDLAELALRLPRRVDDPALYDRIVGACREAGFEPRLGRPIDSLEDAIVEMTNGSPAWTVVYGESCGSPGTEQLAIRPLEPPLTVPGSLVVNDKQPPPCLAALVSAFS
jgi:DNA-binding transcriptional LysR family regulator